METADQLEYATFEWVEWYNTRRLHEQIGMIPPTEKETIYYASNHDQNQPVLT